MSLFEIKFSVQEDNLETGEKFSSRVLHLDCKRTGRRQMVTAEEDEICASKCSACSVRKKDVSA